MIPYSRQDITQKDIWAVKKVLKKFPAGVIKKIIKIKCEVLNFLICKMFLWKTF